jgi:hypothetical protein
MQGSERSDVRRDSGFLLEEYVVLMPLAAEKGYLTPYAGSVTQRGF